MKNQHGKTILTPRSQQVLKPADFARLSEAQKNNIKEIHFEMPRIGKKGFGRFLVTYKTPVLS